MSEIIGIDLGTTNSLAAYLADDGPRVIPNALDSVLTPSVVGIDKQQKLLVGAAARELQVLQPQSCASLFKRYMGTDWKANLGGRAFTPEELSGLVACNRRSRKTPSSFPGHARRAGSHYRAGLFQRSTTQGHAARRTHRRPARRANPERTDRRGPGLRFPRSR